MKNIILRTGAIATGLASGLLVAVTSVQTPVLAQAQSTQNQRTIAADGRLNEYNPNSAPTLKRGSSGAAVQDVQQLLRSRGFYYGAIDGIYGPRTISSIITI